MESRSLVESPEGELHLHAHGQVLRITVRQLGIDPASPVQVNNDQHAGKIKGKGGPLIDAEGEQFASLVNDPLPLELILRLAPHAETLGRKLNMAAGPASLAIPPEKRLSFTVKHICR